MKPAPFDYHRPASIDAALEAMHGCKGAGKYIAGGQTLGPMINLRLVQPDLLIDISGIDELRRTMQVPGGVRIGAAVRHAEIEDARVADPSRGLMPRVARTLAYRAIRNRGTIGGSLAHADPVAEWPTVLMALAASIHIRGRAGDRVVPISDFLVDTLTTSLADDEILVAVTIPVLPEESRLGYRKFARKSGEFAHSLVAVVLPDRAAGRVVLGCAAGTPILLPNVLAVALSAKAWRKGLEEDIRRATAHDLASAGADPDAYEAHLHATIVSRAVEEALQ